MVRMVFLNCLWRYGKDGVDENGASPGLGMVTRRAEEGVSRECENSSRLLYSAH